MHRDVASIRSAANGHDPAAAHAAVRRLEADVSQLRAGGKLAPADASVLVADAGQIDRKVPAQVPAPASAGAAPASPATPATPTAPQQPQANGKGKDKGHGHGKGGDGGDGGD